jgi:hypothetical protein
MRSISLAVAALNAPGMTMQPALMALRSCAVLCGVFTA